jgi:hypothetical protein
MTSSLPRILTIMGSGETAPTMVSTHRRLTSLLPKPVNAALLDTPYGFQENAPELAARAVEYFKTSITVDINVAGLERLHDTHIAADPVQIERGLRALDNADYIFSGPGSPTYALRHWAGTRVAEIVRHKLINGGIVTFASAAALTLGKATVPVYEIYKVGQDVQRLDGLDILSTIGVNAAVIPHYDNAEGGHHDTRFCYLGEARLQLFESMLDAETFVLGIDEHTGLVINLDTNECEVVGKGGVTLRLRGANTVYPTGSTFSIAVLQNPWTSAGSSTDTNSASGHSVDTSPSGSAIHSSGAEPTSLDDALAQHVQTFEGAMGARDAVSAVRAALALETAIHEWSTDTLQSDTADRARDALRSMISQLGDAAVSGVQDPRDVVAPYVDGILGIRKVVRAEKRFDLSDLIRDLFAALNIEVRDTPNGVEWELRD